MSSITAIGDDNNLYTLLTLNKSGGEGVIYRIQGNPTLCAKIYHDSKIRPEIQDKIKAMVGNPPEDKARPNHNSIAWPTMLLYKDKQKKHFIGFCMPIVSHNFKEAHNYWDSEDRIKNFGGGFNYEYLLTAAVNIASVIAAIHNKQHRIGDLRDRNILIESNALVTIIDCDSFQIRDRNVNKTYYSRVGTGDYLPPELFNKDFGKENVDRYYSDLFGLGIIIFQFLMIGFHPYGAKGKRVIDAPTTVDKIKKGFFVYSGNYKDISPPTWAPSFDIIFPGVKELFCRCFIEGHKDPTKRPSAKEWFDVLKEAKTNLVTCKKNQNHKYFNHLNYCPWCRHQKEHYNFDPFPLKKPISKPPRPSPTPIHVVPPPPLPSALPAIPKIEFSQIGKIIAACLIIVFLYSVFPNPIAPSVLSDPNPSSTSPLPITGAGNTVDLNNATFLIQKGEEYLDKSEYMEAIDSFNQAVAKDPSKKNFIRSDIQKIENKADNLFNSGNDYSNALQIYNYILSYTSLDSKIELDIMQKKLFCLKKLGKDGEANKLNLQIQQKFFPDQYKKY